MPPYNTTLMGVVQGALDYHGIILPPAMVFGMSGHAFLINIHVEICPSGPYCWNGMAMRPLLNNMGLDMEHLGFFGPDRSPDDRAGIEKTLRQALDDGIPCSLLNLENQLIAGYDDDSFVTLKPWKGNRDFPPARLTFGSWKELGETFHVSFFRLNRVQPAERRKAIVESLDYAVDLHTHPERHSREGYGVGPRAYDLWIEAVEKFGSSHGNWWNATVWSECRTMASAYCDGIAKEYGYAAGTASILVPAYAEISDLLSRVADKALEASTKAALLKAAQSKEADAIHWTARLADILRAGA